MDEKAPVPNGAVMFAATESATVRVAFVPMVRPVVVPDDVVP